MTNFRSVYRAAEEQTKLYAIGLFLILLFLVFAQTFFSSFVLLSLVLSLLFIGLTIKKPLWTLGFLSLYLPFESFLLKFIPEEIYIFARYFSEGLIYVLALVVLWKLFTGRISFRRTIVDVPFVLFLLVIAAGVLINFVPPTIALLGMRQILRFMLVFFLAVYLSPSKVFVRKLTMALLVIVFIQSVLGIVQHFAGGSLDDLLLSSQEHAYGELLLTSGVDQFWDEGSRVFATLGRYDRLGNFLYIFLLIMVALLYEKKQKPFSWLLVVLGFGTLALLFTFSRASWFAFLLGIFFIGFVAYKDKRVLYGLGAFLAAIILFLGISNINVHVLTESSGQTLVERFYETFSYARWQGEYYGLGRTYWMIQTPLVVVPSSPFFGFGPGQFGAGAALALQNTRVYDELGLPFGIFGTGGVIDNNWFSLWGETGTLGLIFYGWIWVGLFLFSFRLFFTSKDAFVRALSVSFCAMLIAVGFNAFLSTVFEIRTLAFYVWMYGGFVVGVGEKELACRS